MTLQASFKNLAAAGKAYGHEHEYYGKSGGWIYKRQVGAYHGPLGELFEIPICQGWKALGERMMAIGNIKIGDDGRYTIQ